MRICAVLAVAGALFLANNSRDMVMSSNATSVIANLRNTQLESDSNMLKSVATLLACGGLLVILVEACRAVRDQSNIPLRGWLGLLAYIAVTITNGGRPGFILATLSLIIAEIASVYLFGLGFAAFRKIMITGCLLVAICIGYITFVVSTRNISYTGGMDNKIDMVNSLMVSNLDPNFRESLRPFGAFGDAVIESFYYLGTQFPGLDFALRHSEGGPYGLGLEEVPFLTRRLESLTGKVILQPMWDAQEREFAKYGVFPHFFATAPGNTLGDFGVVLSIPFVFLGGVVSRRARFRALQSRAPFSIALQALICTGAAWTIILSPLEEQSWSFPLMWFILIYIAHRVGAFSQGPLRSVSKIRTCRVGENGVHRADGIVR
jgi:hypothetical protein